MRPTLKERRNRAGLAARNRTPSNLQGRVGDPGDQAPKTLWGEERKDQRTKSTKGSFLKEVG